jgi:hypothetical protein
MLVLLVVTACNKGGDTATTDSLPYSLDPVETPDWYEDIKLGMTYDEVVRIAGYEGTLADDVEHSTEEAVYRWSSNAPWIVTVVFENGLVTWRVLRTPG